MGTTTSRYGLFLAAGGSTGSIPGDDQVDVDKLNDAFRIIDASLGVTALPDAALPQANVGTGRLFKATTTDGLVYWDGNSYENLLPLRLQSGYMRDAYFTKGDFADGALDNRYWTQADLGVAGKLDSRYQLKGNYLTSVTAHGQDKHDFKIVRKTWTAQTTASGRGYEKTQRVNFGYTFASPPEVVMTPHTVAQAEQHWGATDIDTTGFTAYYFRTDTTDCVFSIIALGN